MLISMLMKIVMHTSTMIKIVCEDIPEEGPVVVVDQFEASKVNEPACVVVGVTVVVVSAWQAAVSNAKSSQPVVSMVGGNRIF